jgi:purine-binding chemotaxis protein CheW
VAAASARAMSRLVAFVVDGQRFALALDAVERALPMLAVTPLPGAPPVVAGVVSLHGQVVPVFDLRRRLGRPAREPALTDHLLVARAGARRVALPVDEVLGVLAVDAAAITPPDAVLPAPERLAGIVTLADGLVFIHDLETFLTADEERRLAEALDEGGPCH